MYLYENDKMKNEELLMLLLVKSYNNFTPQSSFPSSCFPYTQKDFNLFAVDARRR